MRQHRKQLESSVFRKPSETFDLTMSAAFRKDWEKSGAVNHLVKLLNEGTEKKSDGGISFVAQDHNDLFFLLADCIVAPSDVTRNDVSAASYRAFLDLKRQGNVKTGNLISEIAQRIEKLRKQPRKKYTMWSKMRLRQMAQNPGCRFRLDDVSIRTTYRLPQWLVLEEHFISGVGDINPNTLPFFGYIILSTEARNENEASKKLYAAMDLFYAVLNTSFRSIEFWTERRPSAKVWPGPYHFFFDRRKFLGQNRVWYSPNFDEREWDLFPDDARRFSGRKESYRKIIRSLESHPLREQLERVLILISEGMISKDLSYRLMRFWSAAEALYAASGDRTSISKIIDRMLFATKERKAVERLKLDRAYQLRNSYVHEGSSENDDSSLTQNLRETILNLTYYLIFNGSDIEGHSELLMMFDLPSESEALARRSKAIERKKLIIETGRHRDH